MACWRYGEHDDFGGVKRTDRSWGPGRDGVSWPQADEIEVLGANEHRRWVAERRGDRWVPGPEKHVAKKISPYLVAWQELPVQRQG